MTTNYEIKSKNQVSQAEVFEIISKKAEDKELTYREEKISEYLKKHNKVTLEQFNEIKEKILALEISRVEEEHIIRLIDLMPEDGTQLRSIIQHSGIVIVDDVANNILEILNQYRN